MCAGCVIAELFARYHGGYLLAGLTVGVAVAGMPRRGRSPVVPIAVIAALLPLWVWAGSTWIPMGVTVAAVVVGFTQVALPDPLGGWVHLMGLVSLGGVWAGVPDTEPAVILGGAVLVPALVGLIAGRGSCADRIAYLTAVTLAAWLGAAGVPSLVAGVACVGLLAWPARTRTVPAVVAHTLVVTISSRVVSRLPWTHALGLAAVLVVASGVAVAPLTRARASR
jgi:hypothetical protein